MENDLKEIRAAAVDAQRISDWLISRERERSLGDEKAEPGAAGGRRRLGGRSRHYRWRNTAPPALVKTRDRSSKR